MEVIIIAVVLVGVGLWWVNRVNAEKSKNDNALDNWTPPKAEDKPWPFGEKLSEGKIHVKTSDVAPGKSEADRVEAPAPVVTNSTPADNVPVAETKPVKKAPAKKTAAKKTAAKPAVAKAPAKKKSV
jgi:hypothetical protein